MPDLPSLGDTINDAETGAEYSVSVVTTLTVRAVKVSGRGALHRTFSADALLSVDDGVWEAAAVGAAEVNDG